MSPWPERMDESSQITSILIRQITFLGTCRRREMMVCHAAICWWHRTSCRWHRITRRWHRTACWWHRTTCWWQWTTQWRERDGRWWHTAVPSRRTWLLTCQHSHAAMSRHLSTMSSFCPEKPCLINWGTATFFPNEHTFHYKIYTNEWVNNYNKNTEHISD